MAKPRHIAFIVDGNRRWAKSHLMPALLGHRQGVKNLKKVFLYLLEEKIEYASFYCFSTENWSRSIDEVEGLINLMEEYFKKGEKFFLENDIKVEIFGDISRFPEKVTELLKSTVLATRNCKALKVGFCLNYGGREDIVQSVNKIINDGKKVITKDDISKNLFTKNFPDPDLVIRTSGELRMSNFMLWQISYSELYFTNKMWPDFDKAELDLAIKEFSKRKRRYGGN